MGFLKWLIWGAVSEVIETEEKAEQERLAINQELDNIFAEADSDFTFYDEYNSLKQLAKTIAQNGKVEDKIVVDLFEYFIVGLLMTLIEKSCTNDYEKEQIIYEITSKLGIDIEVNASEIVSAIKTEGPLKTLTYDIVNKLNKTGMNYLIMLNIAAEKGGNNKFAVEFTSLCTDFLRKTENYIAEEMYPYLGFGTYYTEIMEESIKMVQAYIKKSNLN